MTRHLFRLRAISGRRSGPAPVRATLAALALGLLGAGAAHAADLVPLMKREPPRITSGRPKLHLAAPRLTTVGATAALQHNCNGPQPLFIAHVTLHNAGGPLPARRGLVSVSDTDSRTYHGKSLRLVSAGIYLPAIGADANAVVTVPVSSLASYAGLVGAHQLTVRVMPNSIAGKPAFPRPPFYVFSAAVVPSGFCATRLSVPHASARQFKLK